MDNDLILYTTDDGQSQFVLRALGGQVWLTQLEIAELYQTSKQNISLHVQNILEEGELAQDATVKENLTVQNEGRPRSQTSYSILFVTHDYCRRITAYVLPEAPSLGNGHYPHLGEYLVKGFRHG
ncbi:hypothetical protein P4S72_19480 [Vibrio sp. PP-XX7]